MLLRFSVSNHRSIRDQQELLFSASAPEDRSNGLIPCSAAPGGAVLPLAVIYGANASGKSNLLEALRFMRGMVLDSHKKGEPGGGVPIQSFKLDSTSRRSPSRFEIDFVVDGVRHHYGFQASDRAFEQEWLYVFTSVRPQLWFERTADEFRFGRELKGQNRVIAKLTRPNSLFVSAGAQNDHGQLSRVFGYFQSIVGGVQTPATAGPTMSDLLPTGDELDQRVVDFLHEISTGVVGHRENRKEVPAEVRELRGKLAAVIRDALGSDAVGFDTENDQIVTIELGHRAHHGDVIYLELEAESAGTRRLLVVLSSAFAALDAGTLLCVDELNASLHTLAGEAVVRLFGSRKHNPNGAQLIATTHDTNLLASPLLRRDEIWLTEKDEAGATHLYPLTDIETRTGDNLERGYLQGRFGAVPFANPVSALGED